jgi:hypothetical protein
LVSNNETDTFFRLKSNFGVQPMFGWTRTYYRFVEYFNNASKQMDLTIGGTINTISINGNSSTSIDINLYKKSGNTVELISSLSSKLTFDTITLTASGVSMSQGDMIYMDIISEPMQLIGDQALIVFDNFSYTLNTAVSVPNPPTNVVATAGDTQATISWTAPTNNGGSSITSYTVTSSPGGLTTTTANGNTTTAVVTGLSNGSSYTFTVTAANTAGNSASSSVSNTIIPAVTPQYNTNAMFNTSQIVIMDTTEGTGSTGSLIVHGGVWSRSTSITGDISVNSKMMTPNKDDIIKEQFFTLNNNVSNFTVLPGNGITFQNANTGGFKAQLTVRVSNGGSSKYALWEINGILVGSTWKYNSSFSGDLTGVTFAVVDDGVTGKIKYKNTNASGTTRIGARIVTNGI